MESKFDGWIRCDITCDGISMTMSEYKHFRAVNEKMARDPRNFIVGILFLPFYIIKIVSLVLIMGGVGNRFIAQFVDPTSKLSRFNAKIANRLLCKEKYIDEEYKRIIEVPFWERHPERYTEEYIKETDKNFSI
jgi:hypothetical protein